MGRALLTAIIWCLSALLYFVLLHIMDREGVTGTLFAGNPSFQNVAALLTLMALRVANVLVLPAISFALVIEALLARILRGSSKKNRSESSIVESSQISTHDPNG